MTEIGGKVPPKTIEELYKNHEFYIGLGLAVSSSVFIGSSFIIKKKALIKLNRIGGLRASAGGFGYLKEWIWWAGLLTMGIGEAANFAAYAFAPASLVTPLGALSVLVAAVMASKFLNERLNLLGKLGCLLCVLGSIIIVLHSPKEVEVEDLTVLISKLQDATFIIYVGIVLSVSLFISLYLGPRYGHINVTVYIVLCASIGSLTVMSCKALGLAIRDTISGKSNDFGEWLPYFLIVTTAVFIAIQMNYLNKALDIFNTGIVTPIYYVIFTSLVILASAILFKEWKHMSVEDVIGDICGFFIVIIAVILLNAFQNMDISLNDIRTIMRPRRDIMNRASSDTTYTLDNVLVRQNSKDIKNGYGTNSDLSRQL
ncbi:hypothetical protein HA402_012906 [Bradysia odoriphaga]|nr:hypothetical protein HA402_012906 [Bradysia odoriphaga]